MSSFNRPSLLSHRSLRSLVIGLALASAALAAPEHSGKHAAPAGDTVSAEAKAAYPLTTCVVSDEKLESGGAMGDPIDYIYKQEGKPDRLVRFCCKSCIDDFKKEPAKYLKIIDDAAAKKNAPHAGHHD